MPDEVPKFTHFPDKKSRSYLEQDSLKREYKRDSVRIDFKEVIPRKVRDKHVYTFLVESPESEEVELSLDSVILSPGSHLYFVGKNFYEFGGPVTAEDLKKGFKRLMSTSAFESSGIYVVLVEPGEHAVLRSRISVSNIYYKEKISGQSNARIAGVAPSSHCFPHLNEQAFAVGRVTNTGHENGTFSILNNESSNRRPFILTAYHLVANYTDIQTATFRIGERYICGTSTIIGYRWVGTGSTFLSFNSTIDYLFAELEDDPPMNINYLGWDRESVSNGTLVYGLHHPGGSYYNGRQHYSAGSKTGNTLHGKHIIDWSLGETENGSSGSPLFRTSDNKVLGGLSWGLEKDRYFKLENAWSALSSYLSGTYNHTSINALIPTQITGPKILCYDATTTYSMPNLLAGESVTWSVSGGLQILSTTANSVTVKATNSYINATVTATFTVIRDADNPGDLLTDSRSYQVWLGGPFMSVTNTTTDHTSSGYVMNMSPSSYNHLHFNHELSSVTSVNWSFPSGWSVSGTSGNDVTVWSWSGTSPFTAYATNTCGTVSAFFHPNSSGFRMAVNNSTIYPNVAGDYVRISLSDAKEWEQVTSVRIIDSGTGLISYSEKITEKNHLRQINTFEIDLKKIAKGKYVLEIQYINSRDSHHLIIK